MWSHRLTYMNRWDHVCEPNASRTWNENIYMTEFINRALAVH